MRDRFTGFPAGNALRLSSALSRAGRVARSVRAAFACLVLAAGMISAAAAPGCERSAGPPAKAPAPEGASPGRSAAEPAPAPSPAPDASASAPGSGAARRAIVVGFSQIGAESAWRTANTKSIKDEAQRRGVDLRFSDAQGEQENQLRAIRAFIRQKVDCIAFAPKTEDGWEEVLREAHDAGIPVILTDRVVKVSDPELYVTFIGSDFVEEGRRAAEWLAKKTNGKASIAELQGTPGSAPALDRKRGFGEAIAAHPGMRIVKSQSANFERAKGREVMEAFLRSAEGPGITAVYAHNDDMALGAIQAIKAAGRVPGSDILVVSIDGVRDAFVAMLDGSLNCTVECNPMLGPVLFDTVEQVLAGKPVERHIKTPEGVFEREGVTREVVEARPY